MAAPSDAWRGMRAGGRLGGQNAVLLEGAEAAVAMPEVGVVLPFVALYEGLTYAV